MSEGCGEAVQFGGSHTVAAHGGCAPDEEKSAGERTSCSQAVVESLLLLTELRVAGVRARAVCLDNSVDSVRELDTKGRD